MPELRKNPITREWVIIATERGKRPNDFRSESKAPPPAHSPTCPFCPGNEALTPPEVLAFREAGTAPNTPGWWVRVVPNKYPALAIEGALNKAPRGMYDSMNGVGAHEVIIETPEHDQSIAKLSIKGVEDVLWACRSRYLDLKQDPRLKYVLIFRNHGAVAGASLEHPHSHLIATPMVPKTVMEELEGAERYEQYRDRCIYCDIVRQELDSGERVIARNADFLALEPFASQYPFETWIIPKEHIASFANVNEQQQHNFAAILKETMLRIQICLNDPPYNYMLHTAPCGQDDENRFHWHLEIAPRLAITAGFEMGTGIYINVTPPELAAQYLREVTIPSEQVVEVEPTRA
ncbi:galactose-1-phosphate uridylyltransferase [candidate division KD3-62 bacterium DG_56]|uniref:Galactose-1-phosphate uridylyltransferase n=1 Tax=candidate division KD3-62 bacterium DG_56 TaxID=1704032 RepID=A0A0S7XHE2_9BACT|nr:MAG: galactose-1-phosphate uridylyltransferase [candidate division KD3-62 bacterium DG_56]